MLFVTFLWRGRGFPHHQPPVYGPKHVAVLASMLARHGGHRLACVTDDDMHGLIGQPAVELLALPEPVAGLPGFYPKLWAFSGELAAALDDEPFALIDLDTVILGDLVTLSRPAFAIWAGAKGEAQQYNTSLVIHPSLRPEVWDRFSVEVAGVAERAAVASSFRWTGDQSWVGYVLGQDEPMFGEADGVYQYRPKRHREAPPDDAKVMFMCGPIDPAGEAKHSEWVKAAWR